MVRPEMIITRRVVRRISRGRSAAAFTLIEMVIALALFG
ncbi:MAG: prepilin-type N-terminal cleavage/methylation domain-containing protein, partial [Gaiellaceae bacterium]